MKLTKNRLKELIRQSMDELTEADFSKNLKSKKSGKVVTFTDKDNYKAALKSSDYEKPDDGDEKEKPKTKATKISADPFAKDDEEEFDSGGPSYANVPKGAKTSKQAKAATPDDDEDAWGTGPFDTDPAEDAKYFEEEREQLKKEHPKAFELVKREAIGKRNLVAAKAEFGRMTGEPLFKDKYGNSVGIRDPYDYDQYDFENGEEGRVENEKRWKAQKQKIQKLEQEADQSEAGHAYAKANDIDYYDLPDSDIFDDNFFGKKKKTKEESITSKLKREFKEYDLYNKSMRKL